MLNNNDQTKDNSMKGRFINLSLKDLLLNNKEVFIKTIDKTVNPTFKNDTPSLYKDEVTALTKLNRSPYPKQAEIITAGKVFLEKEDSLLISAEMGTGKTMMGIGIMDNPKNKINMILCPPHLVKKWKKEILETIQSPFTYEVIIVNRWTDLIPYEELINGKRKDVKKRYFFIVSREKAKLCYPKKIAGVWIDKVQEDKDGYSETSKFFCCPKCKTALKANKIKCSNEDCKEPLLVSNNPHLYDNNTDRMFTYAERKTRKKDEKSSLHTRLAIASYVSKRWKRKAIDCLIIDESHEYKGGNTGQGNAMATLCDSSKKKIALTGTVLNGYASSLFYIMWRLKPQLMIKLDYKYDELQKFIAQLGTIETIEKVEDEIGVNVKKGTKKIIKEKAKISPLLLANLLNFTIFLKLEEIKFRDTTISLPDYKEHIEYCDMADDDVKNYNSYISQLLGAIRKNKKLLGAFAVDAINIPDNFNVMVQRPDDNIYVPPSRKINGKKTAIIGRKTVKGDFHSKDKKLFEIIKKNLNNDRKVLVYVTYTNSVAKPLLKSVQSAFPDNIIKILPASVKPENREEWIAENNCDVLITNPELVKTGLDLLEYPTIVFFQLTYNLFTLKQASRRSWRLGQTKYVDVHYLIYNNTAQTTMLNLMSQKLTSANMIEGTLSTDDDLQSLSEDSIQSQLAQGLLSQDKKSVKKQTTLTDNDFTKITREWNVFETYYNDMLNNGPVNEEINTTPIVEDIKIEVKKVDTTPVVKTSKTSKNKVTNSLFDPSAILPVDETVKVKKVIKKTTVAKPQTTLIVEDDPISLYYNEIVKTFLDNTTNFFEDGKTYTFKIVDYKINENIDSLKSSLFTFDSLEVDNVDLKLDTLKKIVKEQKSLKDVCFNTINKKCTLVDYIPLEDVSTKNLNLADDVFSLIENITSDYVKANKDDETKNENVTDINLSDNENNDNDDNYSDDDFMRDSLAEFLDEDEIDDLLGNKEFIIDKVEKLKEENISLSDSIMYGVTPDTIPTDSEDFTDISVSEIDKLLENEKMKKVEDTDTTVKPVTKVTKTGKKAISENKTKVETTIDKTKFILTDEDLSLFNELDDKFYVETTCLFFDKQTIFKSIRDNSLVA